MLVLIGACGCGGAVVLAPQRATHRSGATPRPRARATPIRAYRWMVPTTGAPPTIAQENRARGTRSWRMPGPADAIGGAATGAIAGYVSSQSVTAGQSERVYVSAPDARTVSVRIYRMGWYGGTGGRLILVSAKLPAARQPPCRHSVRTGLTECDWHATLTFPIPSALPSGVYIAGLSSSSGAHSDCIFIVRAARAPEVLVQIPTATYEAYNEWGGDSLYPGGEHVAVTGTGQGVEVSYDRPYKTQTGAGQFFMRDVAIVRFLERYGYPVGYTTSESLDGDPGQVRGARVLIDEGHSEYWSARERGSFAHALARGTSLLFLSSDTMAWRARFAPATRASSQAGEPGHRLIAYKEFARLDPDRAEPTGLNPGGGASLVGSSYDGCITARIRGPGPPRYRYGSWRPAPALKPAWLFAHTALDGASQIPGVVGYELDESAPQSPPGTLVVGSGAGIRCGSEAEPSPAKGTLAQSTLYSAPSGALVFASGTLGWLYGLSPVPQASPDAPRSPVPALVAMTRNLLARALARGPR